MKSSLQAVLATLVLAGCAEPPAAPPLQADEASDLGFLSVSGSLAPDLGGRTSLDLRISNPSEHTLESVKVSFNGTHACPLKDLLVYRGFWEGTEAVGSSRILPGEELTFTFSHDISNLQLMKSASGEGLQDAAGVASIEIQSDRGSGRWPLE